MLPNEPCLRRQTKSDRKDGSSVGPAVDDGGGYVDCSVVITAGSLELQVLAVLADDLHGRPLIPLHHPVLQGAADLGGVQLLVGREVLIGVIQETALVRPIQIGRLASTGEAER